jgi:alpha-ketoglutarate-dependent taurine dioxygenase
MANTINTVPLTPDLGILVTPVGNQFPAAEELIQLFKLHGALLLRGFNFTKESFRDFTASITPEFIGYQGGAYARDPIDGDSTVLSVTGQRQFFAVPMHGEMCYQKNPPTILWFFCHRPPVSGGETTLCDGIDFFEKLSPAARDLFTSRKVKYIRHYGREGWEGIYQTSDPEQVARVCAERDTECAYDPADDTISTAYAKSALTETLYGGKSAFVNNILTILEQESQNQKHSRVRMEDNSPIPPEVVTELKTLEKALTRAVAWQPGDLVMVDNTRLMHGRNAFNDTERELFVRMAMTTF